MMQFARREFWLACLVMFLVFSQPVDGQTSSEAFDAKRLAMGAAGVALVNPSGFQTNPAGYAWEADTWMGTGYSFEGDSGRQGYIAYVEPNNGFAGGALVWQRSDDRLAPMVDSVAYALGGRITPQLALGGAFDWRTYRIGGAETVTGVAADLGVLGTIGQRLAMGLVVKNLSSTISEAVDPRTKRAVVGIALTPDGDTSLALDIEAPQDASGWIRFGGERWLSGLMAIRMGWAKAFAGEDEIWTMGVGIGQHRWEVDYALAVDNSDRTHRLGLRRSF